MRTKHWTVEKVEALSEQASKVEGKLYCVVLLWTNAYDCEVIEVEYFTSKQEAKECVARMVREGGKFYEDLVGGPAAIYVEQYVVASAELKFTVADSQDDWYDEDFVMSECGVRISPEKYEPDEEEVVPPLVKEITPEPEDLEVEYIAGFPYAENGFAVGYPDQSDDDVDSLTWMWNKRKFVAYGHLKTTRLSESWELKGLGIKWTDPNGKEHDVFCFDDDIAWG